MNTNAMLLYLTLIFAIRMFALSLVYYAVLFDNCKDRLCHSCRSRSRRLQGRRLGVKRRTRICFNGSSQIGFLVVSMRLRTLALHSGSAVQVGYTMPAIAHRQSLWLASSSVSRLVVKTSQGLPAFQASEPSNRRVALLMDLLATAKIRR